MDTALDEAKEALLRDIIAEGSDAVSLFLNDTDGLEGEGEQAGYGDLIRCKKKNMRTAPVITKPSPARYIY